MPEGNKGAADTFSRRLFQSGGGTPIEENSGDNPFKDHAKKITSEMKSVFQPLEEKEEPEKDSD